MTEKEEPPKTPEAGKSAIETLPQDSSKEARSKELKDKASDVGDIFNIAAAVSLWALLAGFVVFPAIFPSLQNSSSLNSSAPGRVLRHVINSVPLLVVGIIFFVVGAVLIWFLWHKFPDNYLWLMDRLFL